MTNIRGAQRLKDSCLLVDVKQPPFRIMKTRFFFGAELQSSSSIDVSLQPVPQCGLLLREQAALLSYRGLLVKSDGR